MIDTAVYSSTTLSLFLLGFFGTGHCLGMCGPLILVFPSRRGFWRDHLSYHGGRLMTYIAIGSVFGGIGQGISLIAEKSGFDRFAILTHIQIYFSIIAALFLFIFGLTRLGYISEPQWMQGVSPDKFPGFQRLIQRGVHEPDMVVLFLLGLIFGFLPCGLSFAAFSRALPSGGFLEGGTMLFAFGLGTLPGLLFLGKGLGGYLQKFRKHSDIISGVLMLGMAISLLSDAFIGITM